MDQKGNTGGTKRPPSPAKQQRASSSKQQRSQTRSPELGQQRSKSIVSGSTAKEDDQGGSGGRPHSRSRKSTGKIDKHNNRQSALQQERRGYAAHLKPLYSLKMLQHSFQKQPMKLRADNLFEIVYAILGQMFLSEVDTIAALIDDLK